MKKLGIILGVLVIVAISLFVFIPGERTEVVATSEAETVKLVALPVEGMTCGGCAISVKMALKQLDGVRETKVDVEKGEAVVTYTEGKVTLDQMIKAIDSTGFTAGKPSTG